MTEIKWSNKKREEALTAKAISRIYPKGIEINTDANMRPRWKNALLPFLLQLGRIVCGAILLMQ